MTAKRSASNTSQTTQANKVASPAAAQNTSTNTGLNDLPTITQEARRNAFIYCKFRDEQFALYDEFAKENGILMKTFLVLNVLFYAKEGLTQKEICKRTFHSKQTVSLIVKNLLQQGYVSLADNPADKRNKIVQMTDAGRAYAEKPVRHITWAEDMAMAMFTPEEQEQLIALSRRFTQNLTNLVKENEDSK